MQQICLVSLLLSPLNSLILLISKLFNSLMHDLWQGLLIDLAIHKLLFADRTVNKVLLLRLVVVFESFLPWLFKIV